MTTPRPDDSILPTAHSSPAEVRRAAREGRLQAPTAGLAYGFVQANLVILPEPQANGFLRFCQANPKPCPLLAVSEPGARSCATLGSDLDLARDVPAYRVFREGRLQATVSDVEAEWRDDLVTFALGCSFTFEHALQQAGLPVRHIEEGRNVPMYRTSIPLVPAGGFAGHLVVSMRPMKAADAIRAIQVTTRFPQAHGAPVHLGDPSRIGIADMRSPDYGDAVSVGEGELPVFWACGVTPQQVLMDAGVEFAITHSPGHMLVTDIPDSELALL
ncbi:putative hydro-lyase [Halomonas sp. MCCC 1A17488]|uniref:Putative hydro-lyase HNO51_11350 n=1 Tax=Billgrantia sulfidoxydans TaxID=2733484 RepID=A0ABX7W6M3_9GAMM|nr:MULTISPECIES: putative hydro-lyase [Halomonas]MCE8014994.1 putative hydro-lyase [Halomonas sp. MCCC 1A17488]MCG3238327.1 putative hydro-lyase [Halomonas sp. MCCC 1A17488]QPP47922.1 putative hydro-lyase [Halomonas sp. SS10-MC5]QTP55227.1 putative hydro-lyase [Halomonas sulfidoxydans]